MAKALSVQSVAPFQIGADTLNLAASWDRWIKSFTYFVTGSGISDKAQKRALLLHMVGPDVQEIFETLENTGDDKDYDTAVTKLTEYFNPRKNVSFQRHLFRSAQQEHNETVQEFSTRLKSLALNCEFTDKNEQIRDQIVEKCQSFELRKSFLKEQNLTLEKALQISASHETALKYAKGMEKRADESDVRAVKTKTAQRQSSRHGNTHKFEGNCFNCGRKGHKKYSHECPAREQRCNKCKKVGHFEKMCKNGTKRKPRRNVRNVEDTSTEEEDEDFSFKIKEKFKDAEISVSVGGIMLNMLIDSGSSCNIVDRHTWEFLKKQKQFTCISNSPSNRKLYAYASEKPLNIAGTFCVNIQTNNITLPNIEFLVVEGKAQSILGKDTAIQLNVLRLGPEVNSIQCSIIKNNPELFTGIGKLHDFQLKIPIDETVDPVTQPLRRIPFSLRDKLENKLNDLETLDIIEKVNSPSRWVSPVVVVPKGTDDIRLCIDMRQANKAVKRVRHPIPTVEEVLQDLNGSKFFSKLDISNAYHQLELDPESREITTFNTHVGLFRYRRLLQGVSCASEMFQKVLEQILQNCPGTRNIMDDIIVHAPTKEEHEQCLNNVLKVLKEKGFTLNPEKCQFEMSKVVFMGNVLSEHGVGPTESKVQDVQNARPPRNASEVRSFLGLVNFNARYIQNLATISEPLRRLTRKNVRFTWGHAEQNAFSQLKRSLSSADSLGYFDIKTKTQVMTDAGPCGLSGILLQKQGNDYRVICYASRSLTEVERRYSQTEKEALAIVWACERFHAYIFGIEFELLTDCKALEYIFSPKSKPSARIERWVLRLQGYTYTVRHIKGQTNISDCLSRLLNEKSEHRSDQYVFDEEYVKFVARAATPEAVTTRDIEKASKYDPEMSAVRDCLMYGLWYKLPYKEYLVAKHELSAIGYLVLRGTRIVVPTELREKILDAAHSGHPGIVSMKQSLRALVWWPGIDRDVENVCKTCHGCQLVGRPTPPEPLKPTELPNAPWEYLACDLLGPLPTGEQLVVVIDYYSRFMEIEIIKSATSERLTSVLKKIFSRNGIPFYLRVDNASYFTSDYFQSFLKEYGIKVTHSTPLSPQQNGLVERQMSSIMKRIRIAIVEKRDWKQELDTYLLMYRSSPHSTVGVSPAELLYGRKIRTKIPQLRDYGKVDFPDLSVRDRDSEQKTKSKLYTDGKRNAQESDISVGDKVLLKVNRQNKTDTQFSPKPFIVLAKKRNAVTIERNGIQYKRDITHVKKYHTPLSNNARSHDSVKRKTKKPVKYKDYVCHSVE